MNKQHKKNRYPNLILQPGIIKDQVYVALKQAILDGRLKTGEKIPSSRTLADMLSVSRNSILAGLAQLLDEGYLMTQAGSGTYVANNLPETYIIAQKSSTALTDSLDVMPDINPNSSKLLDLWHTSQPLAARGKVFNIGIGCVDIFPDVIWRRLLNKAWRFSKNRLGRGNDPKGDPLLRKNICDYVRSVRGIHCSEEQIIIVNGTQQALSLVSQVILQKNDHVWLDDPGYDGALAAFTAAGANVFSIPGDDQGMDIEAGQHICPDAKLVFTAPSHQFPLGNTLSLARRLALLEWSAQKKIWIMEDDYNSEFRYSSRPIQALQGLDKNQRVIYAGTFSKMIFPELRIGFLVLPPNLVDIFTLTKYYSDSCNSHLEQIALSLFIEGGHYAKHVRQVRKACYERKTALIKAIHHYLPNHLAVQPSDSGIHLVCQLLNGLTEEEVIQKSLSINLGIQPLSRYCRNVAVRPSILLGFAAHNELELIDGIKRLAAVLT